MKKKKFDPSTLQIVYIIVFLILFGLIIYIPHVINNPVHITERLIIEEEIIEGFLLSVLFLLNVWIFNLYKNETARQMDLIEKIRNEKKSTDEKLVDSFRYIGRVNVQIQLIKSIFNSSDRFPRTKNDFKKTLQFFSDRVLGIVNTPWVLFRIINSKTQRTVSEQFETRHGLSFDYPHISNKMIIEQQACTPYTTVISNPQDLKIMVCCTMPVEKITNDERAFIQAITNEVTMIFVIMDSAYYKETVISPAEENNNTVDLTEHLSGPSPDTVK